MEKAKRCAVYTRKSSEEGLEQDFNSLQAQREACEAYIASQRGEGWKLVPTAYDDGGISGGTMERPALQRLLQDISLGQIDVIVVYKVDRLTRALTDFAKMVELFDAKSVSFVAVTQQFNTTTSMGRLTLNVLLSFAQFEREVTGERIRDKIAASKKKGMWMGGKVPLGYRVESRKLLVRPDEAERVRQIFQIYLQCSGVAELVSKLKAAGIRSRERADGPPVVFGKGALYHILANPIFMGVIAHKGNRYQGQHEAIVSKEIWEAVQVKLAAGAVRQGGERVTEPSVLIGKIRDEKRIPLQPRHTIKRGRRYRYYCSRGERESSQAWRLPALEFEKRLTELVGAIISDRPAVMGAAVQAGLPEHQLGSILNTIALPSKPLEWVEEVHLHHSSIRVVLTIPGSQPIRIEKEFPIQMRRRGVEQRLVIPGCDFTASKADPVLTKMIARAYRWWELLKTGKAQSIAEIGSRESISASYITQLMPLAFLSPKIVEAICEGDQPAELTTLDLLLRKGVPLNWKDQRERLGFD